MPARFKKPEEDLRNLRKTADYPQNLVNAMQVDLNRLYGSIPNAQEIVPKINSDDIIQALKSSYLDRPDDRYRKIISWYFKDHMTFDEIGTHLQVSRSRAGQIINKAMCLIRKILCAMRIQLDSADEAENYIKQLGFRFDTLQTEKNENCYRWGYTKSGGRFALLAEYDGDTRILTVYLQGFHLIQHIKHEAMQNKIIIKRRKNI